MAGKITAMAKKLENTHVEKMREEGTLEERRVNPDLNTNDPNLHRIRLTQFQRSKYNWTMYYMGKKGGIYTVSYNGNKVYKHQ